MDRVHINGNCPEGSIATFDSVVGVCPGRSQIRKNSGIEKQPPIALNCCQSFTLSNPTDVHWLRLRVLPCMPIDKLCRRRDCGLRTIVFVGDRGRRSIERPSTSIDTRTFRGRLSGDEAARRRRHFCCELTEVRCVLQS